MYGCAPERPNVVVCIYLMNVDASMRVTVFRNLAVRIWDNLGVDRKQVGAYQSRCEHFHGYA